METGTTERFSGRVDDYVRHRPNYPPAVIDEVLAIAGLCAGATVADVGSGTGILSSQLLGAGLHVYGVEPNAAMRAAAEVHLEGQSGFTSVAGSAEVTDLPATCVDAVTCAQAFHWFDMDRARDEFRRILRPGGMVAILWNERRKGGTPFLEAYEGLLQTYGTDYNVVDHTNVDRARLAAFFGGEHFHSLAFDHEQRLDRDGLHGRVASSSYVPGRDSAGWQPLVAELDRIFDRCHQDGCVIIEYATTLHIGTLR